MGSGQELALALTNTPLGRRARVLDRARPALPWRVLGGEVVVGQEAEGDARGEHAVQLHVQVTLALGDLVRLLVTPPTRVRVRVRVRVRPRARARARARVRVRVQVRVQVRVRVRERSP